MRDKKEELNQILSKYSTEVQMVYKNVLKQEKGVKNIRKDQIKTLIDSEIMAQVNNK